MIKITTNFDSRKFVRELQKQAYDDAEKQVSNKLRDLVAKGLNIRRASNLPNRFKLNLEGPDELVEEAKRRLS